MMMGIYELGSPGLDGKAERRDGRKEEERRGEETRLDSWEIL
jgi:hypothetical protein